MIGLAVLTDLHVFNPPSPRLRKHGSGVRSLGMYECAPLQRLNGCMDYIDIRYLRVYIS
jgi:hypothetical protein